MESNPWGQVFLLGSNWFDLASTTTETISNSHYCKNDVDDNLMTKF